MKVSHSLVPVFDDPNLTSLGGLPAVMVLAERAGLHGLAGEHVKVPGHAGANPHLKIAALVAGMVAGADSITGLEVLRHGAAGKLFKGLRAATTLGTHLRAYKFGHVRQLDAVAARFLTGLAGCSPILNGASKVAFVDVDDTIRQTHGYKKQGCAYGYSGVKGVNAQVAVISTPVSAPVIACTRLRKGNVSSAHGAPKLIGDALATLRRAAGQTPELTIVRADSAYYRHDFVAAVVAAGAKWSVTARQDKAVRAAIAAIGEQSWKTIRYTDAIWDDDQQRWISDAQVAETGFTAFTSRRKTDHITARLIVRRVKRLGNVGDQDELIPGWRYHAVFTNSPLPMVEAEACHRDHAIIEQVFADLKSGPLAHAPSGKFCANAAWLVLAAMAFNLTRAAGALASTELGKARTDTIRRKLIQVAARIANQARSWILHLPAGWPWQPQFERLHDAALAPPPAATA